MVANSRRLALATGMDYHVLEWEPSEQTGSRDLTILLVHGFTDLAYGWSAVAERLAPFAHVIAPDLRGHGDSGRIGAGGYYHFMDYVADLDDVVRQLARSRLIVVGHSMGGSVSAYWAAIRPQRLEALVLIEGLGPPDLAATEGPDRTRAWIEAWSAARAKGDRVMASIDEAAARLVRYDPLLDVELARQLAHHGTRATAAGVVWKHDPAHMTMGPYPFRVAVAERYWANITCPVLAIDGAESRLNLSAEERARRRGMLESCRAVEIPGAGHAVHKHQPGRVAELVVDMLERERVSPSDRR